MLDYRCPHQVGSYQVAEAEGPEPGFIISHPARRRTLLLNSAAVVIWGLCDGQRTVIEITDILIEAYPDNADSIAADVQQTLLTLTEYGAIEWS